MQKKFHLHSKCKKWMIYRISRNPTYKPLGNEENTRANQNHLVMHDLSLNLKNSLSAKDEKMISQYWIETYFTYRYFTLKQVFYLPKSLYVEFWFYAIPNHRGEDFSIANVANKTAYQSSNEKYIEAFGYYNFLCYFVN